MADSTGASPRRATYVDNSGPRSTDVTTVFDCAVSGVVSTPQSAEELAARKREERRRRRSFDRPPAAEGAQLPAAGAAGARHHFAQSRRPHTLPNLPVLVSAMDPAVGQIRRAESLAELENLEGFRVFEQRSAQDRRLFGKFLDNPSDAHTVTPQPLLSPHPPPPRTPPTTLSLTIDTSRTSHRGHFGHQSRLPSSSPPPPIVSPLSGSKSKASPGSPGKSGAHASGLQRTALRNSYEQSSSPAYIQLSPGSQPSPKGAMSGLLGGALGGDVVGSAYPRRVFPSHQRLRRRSFSNEDRPTRFQHYPPPSPRLSPESAGGRHLAPPTQNGASSWSYMSSSPIVRAISQTISSHLSPSSSSPSSSSSSSAVVVVGGTPVSGSAHLLRVLSLGPSSPPSVGSASSSPRFFRALHFATVAPPSSLENDVASPLGAVAGSSSMSDSPNRNNRQNRNTLDAGMLKYLLRDAEANDARERELEAEEREAEEREAEEREAEDNRGEGGSTSTSSGAQSLERGGRLNGDMSPTQDEIRSPMSPQFFFEQNDDNTANGSQR